MIPLFKYLINTAVIAPVLIQYVLKIQLDYSQVLNILAVASFLNVLANTRFGFGPTKFFHGIFGLIAGTGFYYLMAVIFGAYLCDAYHRTLMWAVWMASMTSHPLALIYGLDFNKWYELVIRRNNHGDRDEARLICSIYSLWAGSWAGAIVIPLDWDRAWQKWPIPNVVGSLALALTTSLGFCMKDGCKCCWSACKWTGFCTKANDTRSAATPAKAKATPVKRTPKKAAAAVVVSEPSPAKAVKTPTRKATAASTRARSRSPSKSPVKRSASPSKAAPSTPKASGRSRSKVATPSATGRASSRISKRTRD